MKHNFKNSKNLHGFFIEKIGLVLGKPLIDNNDNWIGIHSFRIVQINQQAKTAVLTQLLGNPESYFFSKFPDYFEIKDDVIKEMYAENISGIKVTSQMPPVTGPTLVKS